MAKMPVLTANTNVDILMGLFRSSQLCTEGAGSDLTAFVVVRQWRGDGLAVGLTVRLIYSWKCWEPLWTVNMLSASGKSLNSFIAELMYTNVLESDFPPCHSVPGVQVANILI